jgi:WD40 repeat protein
MKHCIFSLILALAAVFAGSASASEDKIGVSSDNPSLSPSGQELVFSADFDGPSRLWISGLDGSRLRKVSSLGNPAAVVTDLEPSWSPDGRTIAYRSIDGSTSDIWIMQADGSYPVKLTANGAENGHPAWSPDGRKIVFESDKDGTRDIWIMNADGTQQVKVLSSSGVDNGPKFSPAGDKIVFSRSKDGAATLMIVNVNGTGLRALTTGNSRDWEPSWGSRGILFSSNRSSSSGGHKIWMVQPDGSNLRKVGDAAGFDPIWLTDGRIAFTDDESLVASKALAAVSILNPATGQKQVVADVQGYITPIDIRPGKTPKKINPKSMGRAEVAILSTQTFDATKAVNQASITFGRSGAESSLTQCNKKFKDINGDGIPDLTCRFALRYAGFQMGGAVGVLRFTDTRGKPYEGRDAITTVGEDDPDDFKD